VVNIQSWPDQSVLGSEQADDIDLITVCRYQEQIIKQPEVLGGFNFKLIA